ncbi:MAG: hypothetical protein ACSHWW_05655 [Nonlabens sp.]|uniref:hypothetical protein n=1 Tax=Nonlabens sp. TaxID=1888209 RepID=UPI003EF9875B
MKNILQLALLMICSFAMAQTVDVKDIKVEMTKGMQPGVEVFIQGANEDQVRDAIKDNTRKFRGDDERIKRSDERYIDDARIKELSDNDIDIHYLIKETDKGSTLQMFFNMGVVFLSPDLDANKYNFMRKLASQIAVDATQLNYDELIEEEEKILSRLIRDKKNSEDDIKKAQRDIEKAKKEIAEKEQEIKELERKVGDQTELVSKQNDMVKDLKNQKAKAKR